MPVEGEEMRNRRTLEAFAGCLLGGAVGDALGAPVEFMSLGDIRRRFGPSGVADYAPAYGVQGGAITDDTQMTIFTAEGLIRADNRFREKGICHPPTMLHDAYLRWLATQNHRPRRPDADPRRGWLLGVSGLHARRAPGNTCLSALESGKMGTIDRPLNNSKGCGGVMRVAPVGLVGKEPFQLGCEAAAITHSHPSGYLAAGFFASVISRLVRGATLEEAIGHARGELTDYPGHQECLDAVDRAMRMASEAPAMVESVETLGQGWVAEEALAIALFCALKAEDFQHGVLLAVNHGGDSDSTGAMAGNLLGLIHGKSGIRRDWLERLELREVIEEVAADLWRQFGDHPGRFEPDWERY
ncbi:MAG TPA: ADP-ribosylglycohydrolase family protein, partial [Chloroflexota bacterium]|nr:ADP-ribosylglycohydrolase family protein [Chloroflexota bacterium]